MNAGFTRFPDRPIQPYTSTTRTPIIHPMAIIDILPASRLTVGSGRPGSASHSGERGGSAEGDGPADASGGRATGGAPTVPTIAKEPAAPGETSEAREAAEGLEAHGA